MHRSKLAWAGLALGVLTLVYGARIDAFNSFARWSSPSVVFYVNPNNADVSANAAETAIKYALNVWGTQGNSAFEYVYGGRVSDTNTSYDGRNVVVFRNASSGSALATTYSWYSGGTLVDSDIVVWDGAFKFFTGTSGCSKGAYIEDILTHELGHALGLDHSGNSDATMYATYKYCSTKMRSLAADDIAGVQSLYPAAAAPVNSAPSLTLVSPASGSYVEGAPIVFAASASDSQDGDLTSGIKWTSSLTGTIGSGGSITASLTAGTHVITASVADSGGLTAAKQVSIVVEPAPVVAPPPPPPPPPSGTPALTITSTSLYGKKSYNRTELAWTGFSATSLDVYRDGSRVAVVSNTGAWADTVGHSGTGWTYHYKVCGSGTSTCSNEVVATF